MNTIFIVLPILTLLMFDLGLVLRPADFKLIAERPKPVQPRPNDVPTYFSYHFLRGIDGLAVSLNDQRTSHLGHRDRYAECRTSHHGGLQPLDLQ